MLPKGDAGAKGDTGDSGVYIGTSAPADSNKTVWIDTDDSSSITIPTKTSELTNDSGFVTSNYLNSYATISYVDGLVGDVESLLGGI